MLLDSRWSSMNEPVRYAMCGVGSEDGPGFDDLGAKGSGTMGGRFGLREQGELDALGFAMINHLTTKVG